MLLLLSLMFFFCRELDHAMLRRLEKRILVDLPNHEGRKAMLYHHLPPVLSGELELQTELDYDSLATVAYAPRKKNKIQ